MTPDTILNGLFRGLFTEVIQSIGGVMAGSPVIRTDTQGQGLYQGVDAEPQGGPPSLLPCPLCGRSGMGGSSRQDSPVGLVGG